jgi:threonine/homoserine/homoserine lactone efflux protein
MVTALLVGIALGFVISIPPGPIAVAVIIQALDGNYRHGTSIAAGAAIMDVLYTLVAAFASSAIVVALKTFITGHQIVMVGFQVVCIGVLVTLGFKYFHASTKEVVDSAQKEKVQEEKARRLGFSSPLMVGIMIAVTNLASPTFIPSLVFFAGMAHAKGFLGDDPWENALYAVGFGVGAGLWFFALLRALYAFRTKLPPRFITYIYYFAGGVFAVSAVLLSYNVLTATEWSRLFGG